MASSQVFQKIQKRLNHGLSKQSAQQLEQRLAKQYQEYLHTVNTTAGVFRDTIAAEDYDPLAPRYAPFHTSFYVDWHDVSLHLTHASYTLLTGHLILLPAQ